MGSHFFGRNWNKGDVVGCMINMEDKSMIFTLNGEILITNKGSELCFADFEMEDGKDHKYMQNICKIYNRYYEKSQRLSDWKIL